MAKASKRQVSKKQVLEELRSTQNLLAATGRSLRTTARLIEDLPPSDPIGSGPPQGGGGGDTVLKRPTKSGPILRAPIT